MSPQLPLCSSKQVISVLKRCGFERGPKSSGSHQSYVKEMPSDRKITVIVVEGKSQIPRGTLRGILRRAHIKSEEFVALLR